MWAAVLTLAFEPLGAQFAITSAWSDNRASLGVSRALGYADNGVTADRRNDVAGKMAHLRLTREQWTASRWPRSGHPQSPGVPFAPSSQGRRRPSQKPTQISGPGQGA
jgi:hypothetical protein